jgi:hypothetical protein
LAIVVIGEESVGARRVLELSVEGRGADERRGFEAKEK